MINLFSDTQTQPSAEMRAAMANAPVGDEQLAEDPTVLALQELAASMLGKEASLFLPSGTMCNLIAVKTHARPGDMVIVDKRCHIMRAESGGAAMFSGVMLDAIETPRGIFTPEQVLAHIPSTRTVYHPFPTLLCVENTHNYGGGAVWTKQQLLDVCSAAKSRGLATHMDGARLFNAAIASSTPVAELAEPFDSVWIDLSKGLGCPVGAVLAGSRDFIERARRYKHAFGGAMRQAGIIAAAGVYALKHNIARLTADHSNARLLASAIEKMPRARLLFPVDTNIVFFTVDGISPTDFAAKMKDRGVRFSTVGAGIRAVTHLDISTDDIRRAIELLRAELQ